MTVNSFAQEAGIKTKFIPYPSGDSVEAAALGGEVDIYVDKVVNVVPGDTRKSNNSNYLSSFGITRAATWSSIIIGSANTSICSML
nr:hypothetical protein [Lentibacillus daqui]